MTSVSTTTVTDPSSVNTEPAGVEDAESSQGGKPAQPEPGKDLTAEEEALLIHAHGLSLSREFLGISPGRGSQKTPHHQLAVKKPASWAGWGARNPATRQASPRPIQAQ